MRAVTLWLPLLLVSMVPVEASVTIAGFGTLTRLVGVVTFAVWVLAVLVTGEVRKPHLFHWALFYFILWNVVSYFWSTDTRYAFVRYMTYFQLLGFTLILWDFFTTPAALKAGLQAYIVGAYVTIGSTVANYLAGNAVNSRYGATGFNPNDFSQMLALGMPMAWYLAASKNQSHSKTTYILKLANLAYVPAAMFAILLSGSRGSFVAALPAFAFILWSSQRLKFYQRILIFIALTLSLFAFQSLVPQSSFDRLASIDDSIASSDWNGRLYIWGRGLNVFIEHPLLGVGSAAFKATVGKNAHNSFIAVLVELGIIGFTLFAIILAIAVYSAAKQSKWESQLWLTVLAVLALGNAVHSWEYRKATWLFLCLTVVSANCTIRHLRSGEDLWRFPRKGRMELETYPLPEQELETGIGLNSMLSKDRAHDT